MALKENIRVEGKPDIQTKVMTTLFALFAEVERAGGGRLDEVVDAEVVRSRVLEDGEALAANVLLRGRNPQIGDGLHGLSMECGFGYCI